MGTLCCDVTLRFIVEAIDFGVVKMETGGCGVDMGETFSLDCRFTLKLSIPPSLL